MFSGIGGFEYGIEQASAILKKEKERIGEENKEGLRGEKNASNNEGNKGLGISATASEQYFIESPDRQFNCVGYSEIDKYAVATYTKHFPTHRNFGDAREINPRELPDFDLLCGGFPCQSFSIAGKRRGFEDTRGTLFFEIARILEVKRPAYILLENVKGLLNHDKGKTFACIIQTLSELGYDVQWLVLNSKFFGVPQNRERVFIIGNIRGSNRPEILPFREADNKYNESEPKLAMIEQLNKSDKKDFRVFGENGIAPSCQARSDTHKIEVKSIQLENKNRTVKSATHEFMVAQALQTDGYLRQGSSFGTNNPASSRNIRRLTPIECERLQGFPDNWTAGVSDTQRYKQLGNAVTTKVITAIMGNWK
jgi:DNA (cytosine-5)-methyltransferase 1